MRSRKHIIEAERKESHVLARLKERYGLSVTHSQLDKIRQRITSGDGIPLCRQNDVVLLVELPYGGKRVILAFDTERDALRTALPARGTRTVEDYLNHLRSEHFSW